MKKLIFIIPALFSIAFVLSVIHADEDTKEQPETKKTEKPETPEETPKVDPNKKYEIKLDFKQGMSFERTETISTQTTNTLFNSDLTVKRTIKSHEVKSTDKLNYKILDVKDGIISKFKLEFPEYSVLLGNGLLANSSNPESTTMLKNQWIEAYRTKDNNFKVNKYSAEFGSLISDEDKLYKGMLTLSKRNYGGVTYHDMQEQMILHQYKPNYLHFNGIASKLIFPDYSPHKSVSIGETWKVSPMQVQKDDNNVHKFANKRLIGFIGEFGSTIEIEFKLESIKSENSNEFAVISITYKYSRPVQKPYDETYEVSYNGMIVHNMSKNCIVYLTVNKDYSRSWQQSEFGKYVTQSTNSKTFEYKYSD